jgi:DNA-directed RNA polymerase III subunit RPC8
MVPVSVGFFDDIYVPLAYLPQPSALYVSWHCIFSKLLTGAFSDPNERAHFWLPDSEATTPHELLESPIADRMYIDQSEVVRVRVEADEFYDDEPGPPKAAEGVAVKREVRRAPYSIIVSLQA